LSTDAFEKVMREPAAAARMMDNRNIDTISSMSVKPSSSLNRRVTAASPQEGGSRTNGSPSRLSGGRHRWPSLLDSSAEPGEA
jgi:hypothetical protein